MPNGLTSFILLHIFKGLISELPLTISHLCIFKVISKAKNVIKCKISVTNIPLDEARLSTKYEYWRRPFLHQAVALLSLYAATNNLNSWYHSPPTQLQGFHHIAFPWNGLIIDLSSQTLLQICPKECCQLYY